MLNWCARDSEVRVGATCRAKLGLLRLGVPGMKQIMPIPGCELPPAGMGSLVRALLQVPMAVWPVDMPVDNDNPCASHAALSLIQQFVHLLIREGPGEASTHSWQDGKLTRCGGTCHTTWRCCAASSGWLCSKTHGQRLSATFFIISKETQTHRLKQLL